MNEDFRSARERTGVLRRISYKSVDSYHEKKLVLRHVSREFDSVDTGEIVTETSMIITINTQR